MDRIVPRYPGGGEAAPGAGRDQRLGVLAVDGVSNPVVEAEDVPGAGLSRVQFIVMLPDGDVGPAPARARRPRPGPVQVREVETGILVSLARGGGTLGLVHHLNARSHTLVTV